MQSTNYSIKPIKCLNDNYCYIIEFTNKSAILIDASEAAPILAYIKERRLNLNHLILTHDHNDHHSGLSEIVSAHPNLCIHAESSVKYSKYEINQLDSTASLKIESEEISIHKTPGHLPKCITIKLDHNFFVGDLIFFAGSGIIMNDPKLLHEQWKSLQWLISQPHSSQLYFGHDLGAANLKFALNFEPSNTKLASLYQDFQSNKSPLFFSGSIETELEINPYLRTHLAEVQHNIDRILAIAVNELGLSELDFATKTAEDYFAKLRLIKNNWLSIVKYSKRNS